MGSHPNIVKSTRKQHGVRGQTMTYFIFGPIYLFGLGGDPNEKFSPQSEWLGYGFGKISKDRVDLVIEILHFWVCVVCSFPFRAPIPINRGARLSPMRTFAILMEVSQKLTRELIYWNTLLLKYVTTAQQTTTTTVNILVPTDCNERCANAPLKDRNTWRAIFLYSALLEIKIMRQNVIIFLIHNERTMRSAAPFLAALAVSGLHLGAASEARHTLSFTTEKNNDAVVPSKHNKVLRQRRAKANKKTFSANNNNNNNNKHILEVTNEDKQFWERVLDETMTSIVPTQAPSEPPCPVRVEIDCVSITTGTNCADIVVQPAGSLTGDDCIVNVEFSYAIQNWGDDVERIYSVQVTRGDMSTVVTDIPDFIPTTDLAPGEIIVGITEHQYDICQLGPDWYSTRADVLAGPPCDVEVRVGLVGL